MLREIKHWTKDEDALLRQRWSEGVLIRDICKELPGRTRGAVKQRIYNLALLPRGFIDRLGKWAPQKVERLKELWQTDMHRKGIAAELNVNVSALKSKAHRLELGGRTRRNPRRITLYVPSEVYDKLGRDARKKQLPLSSYVRQLITEAKGEPNIVGTHNQNTNRFRPNEIHQS